MLANSTKSGHRTKSGPTLCYQHTYCMSSATVGGSGGGGIDCAVLIATYRGGVKEVFSAKNSTDSYTILEYTDESRVLCYKCISMRMYSSSLRYSPSGHFLLAADLRRHPTRLGLASWEWPSLPQRSNCCSLTFKRYSFAFRD